MRGTIKRLSDKGFGFVRAEDQSNREFFFHRSDVQGTSFDDLREGERVEFEEVSSPKGPRAGSVMKV